jgi:ribosomal protein S18 acetylase RimI-like enzyme
MTEIARHGPEVVEELRPLWLAMVHHHAAVAPGMGPVREDEDSWTRRRAHYERQLARDGAFVLVARDGGRAVGYALVTLEADSPTWSEPEDWAEIDSLSVLPEARGQGLGEQLVARVQQEVGDRELRLFAVASNDAARRFYERLGFAPSSVELRRPR